MGVIPITIKFIIHKLIRFWQLFFTFVQIWLLESFWSLWSFQPDLDQFQWLGFQGRLDQQTKVKNDVEGEKLQEPTKITCFTKTVTRILIRVLSCWNSQGSHFHIQLQHRLSFILLHKSTFSLFWAILVAIIKMIT